MFGITLFGGEHNREGNMGWLRRARTCTRTLTAGLRAACLVVACLSLAAPAVAQFDSGSTGANGLFPPAPVPSGTRYIIWNMSTGSIRYCSAYDTNARPETCTTELGSGQIPGIPQGGVTNGVFNFTNFDLSSPDNNYMDMYFVGNANNSPLTILSQQNIRLGSYLRFAMSGMPGASAAPGFQVPLSLAGGKPGPGGFAGGDSAGPQASGNPGFGPAGGAGGALGGYCYGTSISVGQSAGESPLSSTLTPILGGSGGGGGAQAPEASCGLGKTNGGGGGGGGGALLLAASQQISFGYYTQIDLRGGDAGSSQCTCYGGGGGTAGNLRMVAPTLVSPSAGYYSYVYLYGGNGSYYAGQGAGGKVRIEGDATQLQLSINGQLAGSPSLSSTATSVTPTTTPILRIAQVDSMSVPISPSGNVATPDVTFQTAPSGPVAVTLNASHIPVGTVAKVRVTPQVGSFSEVNTTSFSGTTESSTASASVTIPAGYGTISASATFSCNDQICALLPQRERATAVVEVVASAAGSRAFIVTKDGRRIALGD